MFHHLEGLEERLLFRLVEEANHLEDSCPDFLFLRQRNEVRHQRKDYDPDPSLVEGMKSRRREKVSVLDPDQSHEMPAILRKRIRINVLQKLL